MRLLNRYLLRHMALPFVFAFVALTGFMLLNQVARRFGDLAGKGLPWSVIGEVFVLCIPFIVAMTLPFAVLVAVLHSLSHLAADNEVTALRASGVSLRQIVTPLFLAGSVLAVINFVFTDQILPRSNASLRNLLMSIQQKKPTFALREEVVNELGTSGNFLRASRVDPVSGRLRNVTIYDMVSQEGRRIIYADSGRMALTPDARDLSLRLWDGSIQQFKPEEPGLLQQTYFHTNTIRVKDVSNQLDLTNPELARGDREMTSCELLDVVHEADRDARTARLRLEAMTRRDLRFLLGFSTEPSQDSLPATTVRGYCRFFQRIERFISPAPAEAQTPGIIPAPGPPQTTVRPRPTLTGRMTNAGEITITRDNQRTADLRVDQYMVEVHKKWAISFSCIVFVLIGVPLALRFPRGGMGLVIGAGMAVFSIYYVGMIAGEGLADRGYITPLVAMWGPNWILTVLGLLGLRRVSRESGSTRGGDLADLADVIFGRFRRRFG